MSTEDHTAGTLIENQVPITGVVCKVPEGCGTRCRLETSTGTKYLCLKLPLHANGLLPPRELNLLDYVGQEITLSYVSSNEDTLFGASLFERRVPAQGQPLYGPATASLVARRTGALRHEEPSDEPKHETTLEKINLTPDFLPVRFLYDGAIKARAVVRIVTDTSLGTGFLIAPGYIMTNNHVLPSVTVAQSSIAEFFYEEGSEEVRIALLPKQCFITSKALDFTVVAIEVNSKIADVQHIKLTRDALVTKNEPVNIIQHPDGRLKEIAIHNNKVTNASLDRVIKYETDTEPGSSGSPVFNNRWKLVALHHSGDSFAGGRAENEGIRIPPILQFLSENKSVPGVSKLLTYADNISPTAGSFGFVGLPEDAARNESEARTFTGSTQYADVGFWNIENFNNSNSAPDRVEKITKIILDLRLDVLGLVEVETRALQKVVSSLHKKGAYFNYVYYDAPGGDQDLALFYNTETAKVQDKTAEFHNTYKTQLEATVVVNNSGKKQSIFPRKPLFAHVIVDEGSGQTEFIAVVVHLKAMGDSASKLRRHASLKALKSIFDDLRAKGFSVLCGGDYNEPDPDVLDDIFSSTGTVNILTTDDTRTGNVSWVGSVSAAPNGSQLDHIVVTDNLQVLNKGTLLDVTDVRLDEVIPDYDKISDHIPVVLRLIYKQNQ